MFEEEQKKKHYTKICYLGKSPFIYFDWLQTNNIKKITCWLFVSIETVLNVDAIEFIAAINFTVYIGMCIVYVLRSHKHLARCNKKYEINDLFLFWSSKINYSQRQLLHHHPVNAYNGSALLYIIVSSSLCVSPWLCTQCEQIYATWCSACAGWPFYHLL